MDRLLQTKTKSSEVLFGRIRNEDLSLSYPKNNGEQHRLACGLALIHLFHSFMLILLSLKYQSIVFTDKIKQGSLYY